MSKSKKVLKQPARVAQVAELKAENERLTSLLVSAANTGIVATLWEENRQLREELVYMNAQERQIARVSYVRDMAGILLAIHTAHAIANFVIAIGRTKPARGVLAKIAEQLRALNFDEIFAPDHAERALYVRQRDELLQAIDRFTQGKPHGLTLASEHAEYAQIYAEALEAAEESIPGSERRPDNILCKEYVRRAKAELRIDKLGDGDIDRIRVHAQALLLAEHGQYTDLPLVEQNAYDRLTEVQKAQISKWVNR